MNDSRDEKDTPTSPESAAAEAESTAEKDEDAPAEATPKRSAETDQSAVDADAAEAPSEAEREPAPAPAAGRSGALLAGRRKLVAAGAAAVLLLGLVWAGAWSLDLLPSEEEEQASAPHYEPQGNLCGALDLGLYAKEIGASSVSSSGRELDRDVGEGRSCVFRTAGAVDGAGGLRVEAVAWDGVDEAEAEHGSALDSAETDPEAVLVEWADRSFVYRSVEGLTLTALSGNLTVAVVVDAPTDEGDLDAEGRLARMLIAYADQVHDAWV